MDSDASRNITRPYLIFAVLFFLLMIFPLYAVANRVFPLVLGLPFGLFWIVLLEAIAFVVLCLFYRYEYSKRGRS